MPELDEELECVEADDGDCEGSIELRESLTGTGTRVARCDFHWAGRLEREQELREQYPDSDAPPAWFDAELAGESWAEDY